LRSDPQKRIFAILLVLAVLAGVYFRGGDGVSINSLFGAYLAMSILAWLFFSRMQDRTYRWATCAPAVFFGWLLIPWLVVPALDDRGGAQIEWDPPRALERIATAQARFSIARSHFCASSPARRSAKVCCAVISPASLRSTIRSTPRV
jgi:hypothetical protein